MSQFHAVVIGSESLTIACARQLQQRGHVVDAVVTHNDAVREWATTEGLTVLGFQDDLEAGLANGTDWILSIANLEIIPESLLSLARQGAVNFHDGPLPEYAGLNAPVWAKLADEKTHGITWHIIEGGVDEGRILAQQTFEISTDDTALTLNTKCFEAGLSSFELCVDALESGVESVARVQDLSRRSYFGKFRRPDTLGFIDPEGSAQNALRLVRALDHGHFANPLCSAKLWVAGQVLHLAQGEIIPRHAGTFTGEVLNHAPGTIDLILSDGALRLSNVSGAPVKDGSKAEMPTITNDALTQYAKALRSEPYWSKVLAQSQPAALGFDTQSASGTTAAFNIETAHPERLAEALLVMANQNAPDSAIACDVNLDENATLVLSPWCPLTALEQKTERQDKAPFPQDILHRDPALAHMHMPELALSDRGALEGAKLTLCDAVLHFDTHALTPEQAKLIAMRLDHIASALAQGTPVDEIAPVGEAEAALIASWNNTDIEYDTTPIIQMIEAQAIRTPDAIALVVEDISLTYKDLNARANQLAHVLRDKGTVPDTLVGLFTKRSVEMVIGALGIWKAGGAYVPLDPAYPQSRLQGYLEDSAVPVILTTSDLAHTLPENNAAVIALDSDTDIKGAPVTNPAATAQPENLAYLIFTSGSTGRPKGVMVEHRNLSNFCAGMDARLTHDPAGTWLAVTSMNFDISVLELFYTLARGFKVVATSDETRAVLSNGPVLHTKGGMDFSIYYWGNDDGAGEKKYELLLEGAKFADANGFCAVWTPERHFHAFGGPYPNPSVTGAAVAAVTKQIGVRAGSCVAPLHHPARIAEEWAVIDNLTNGRAGLAIASGWQPDDFVLRPENTPPNNKPAMMENIEQVRALWRGEAVAFPKADGTQHEVITQPRPVSKELPIWVTTAGNPETWKEAGRVGANVLTHLLGQSIDEVADKITLYHDALRDAGHDPTDFKVTLMLHTFVAESREKAEEIAREPMKDYLRSAAGLIKQYAWAFPAFKRPEGANNAFDLNLDMLEEDELEGILDFAFLRYFEDSGLFGTVQDCVERVEALKAIGVDEVACLIDYGIEPDVVMQGLKPLADVVARCNAEQSVDEDDFSIAAQLVRHDVTHLQCTPSMARMLCMNEDARGAMGGLQHIMVGGEALPGALVGELKHAAPFATITNMYGPTETTIWSSTLSAEAVSGTVGLGAPIANTGFHVVDGKDALCGIGQEGELCISGAGVTRGYWQRDDLTAERFVVIDGVRAYRTGDLVRRGADGTLEFLGRVDHQIKLRGYRIELGEIEAALEAQTGVTQAVVTAREDVPGDVRLVAYVTGQGSPTGLRESLVQALPSHMVPAHIEWLEKMPLTPNKKVDRAALPAPQKRAQPVPSVTTLRAQPALKQSETGAEAGADTGKVIEQIAAIWQALLAVPSVSARDNFFELGGHSLLAVQAHRDIRDKLGGKLSITDIFRFPVLEDLAAHVCAKGGLVANTPEAPSDRPSSAPVVQGTTNDRADARAAAMSKRRAMRAARQRR